MIAKSNPTGPKGVPAGCEARKKEVGIFWGWSPKTSISRRSLRSPPRRTTLLCSGEPLILYVEISAREEGFEPPNARTKTWCLTTWLLPNRNFNLILLPGPKSGALPLGYSRTYFANLFYQKTT